MPRRSTRQPRRLNLENLENRVQPSTIQSLRVALISDAVTQAAQVEAAAANGVLAVTYDDAGATLDGLVSRLQAISALHGGARISHLGLVAHGGTGSVSIGAFDTLDRNDTAANSPTWDHLRSLLMPNARIDLYACDVATGRDGKAFVNALARRTGAAVYASTDDVGTGQGADLIWEYHTAIRGRSPLFQPAAMKKIAGLVLEDAYEPNNVKAHADVTPGTSSPNFGVLTTQRTVNNLFLEADTEDWFRFDTAGVGTTAHYVRVEGLDPDGDADVYVYAADGVTEIGRGWDGGVEEVSLYGTAPGTYYVRVIPAAAGITTSNYTLQIVAPATLNDDAYETNDVKADADRAPGLNSPNLGTITAQTTLSNLVLRGDEDWFRFETAGVGTTAHYVRLDGIPTSGDVDVYVYASDGVTEIGRGWDGGSEQVELYGTAPGIYYIKVVPADPVYRSSSSNYTLQVVPPIAGGDDPYEQNDVKADADRAPGLHSPNLGAVAGSTVLSNMVLRGDLDWFRFTMNEPASTGHSVRLDGIPTSGDLDVYVYASDGVTEIGRGWDGGSEVVSLAGRPAGTYYIRVNPADSVYRDSSSNYTLQILAPGAGLFVESSTVTEGDGGEINAVFKFSRSDPTGTASVTYETADGTATAGQDYVAKTGTVNFTNGQTTQTVVVKVKGDQSDEDDEDFFLNLTGSTGVTLNTTQAVGVILDDDSAGTVQFSLATYSVKETAGTAIIKVVRIGGSDGQVTIDFTTSDGSAEEPGDYTAKTGTLTFLSGETSKTFSVSIISDDNAEEAESLNLILSNPTGGVELGTLSTAELTIHDPPGTLQFSSAAYVVNENGVKATITVNRVGGAEGTVSVKYATANKTAIAPSDYATETGVLTFLPGETSQTFDVPIVNDDVFEVDELLTLTLSAPTGGARLGVPRTATITIVNDDELMTPGSVVVGAANSGVVKVMDGETGIVKSTIQAFPAGFKGGVRVATGDVNGDGTADIIAAPGPNGATTVRVFDGTTGAKMPGILGEFAHGVPLAGGVFVASGDLNGDNKAEIIVGAGAGGGPHVKVFDGVDRILLREFQAFPGASHGVTVAVGDVSGDSTPDIIVGMDPVDRAIFKVYDWPSDLLGNSISAFTGFAGGVTVATGDVDGDMRADIIVGAGAGGGPNVKVFKGTTGAEIAVPLPSIFAASFKGGVNVAVGDIDGDGIVELVTGSGPGATQKVKIFHLQSGQVLKQHAPFGATKTNGVYVAVAK